jgi:hypothetical protein
MTQQFPSRPEGAVCQSCAMPLAEAPDFGTEAGGASSAEYCHYCYQDGKFTTEATMEEMVEISAKGMAEATDTPEDQARALLRGLLPNLKRWRTAA